ncbi:MAG: endonuclease [Hyphomicrobiales bacterium]|nr:endonuclease [Hyphomicrobiales bacterium]
MGIPIRKPWAHRTPETEVKRIRGRKGQAARLRRLTSEPLCVDCKAAGSVKAAEVVDHIVPLAKGGDDIDSNCRSLCHDCHRKRTAEQFGFKSKQTVGDDGWPT